MSADCPSSFTQNKKNMKYNELFRGMKPLIGMIHTNSTDEYTMLELAKREIAIYPSCS